MTRDQKQIMFRNYIASDTPGIDVLVIYTSIKSSLEDTHKRNRIKNINEVISDDTATVYVENMSGKYRFHFIREDGKWKLKNSFF